MNEADILKKMEENVANNDVEKSREIARFRNELNKFIERFDLTKEKMVQAMIDINLIDGQKSGK